MAVPVARVRPIQRPATLERVRQFGRRAISLAKTTPYRKTTGSIVLDEEALAATNVLDDDAPTLDGTTRAQAPKPTAFGPYLVYEKLGEGGMASVHRAEHVGTTGLRKQVALKRLHTDASEDPSLVSAFVHEAQLAAKLQHPNIAQAYELGRIDNTYYIAMELVPGPTLLQVLMQSRNGGGAVPLSIALEILIQIADALDHAHDLRDDGGHPLHLIHRDVSPANIIISRTGAAKLIDFGIAKVRSRRLGTEAGYIKGKHGYIAPEYTYGHLDHRADLFGLGVVAHELLTGRRLFAADSDPEVLRNVRHMPIPPPSRYRRDISPELDAIVLTALARDPDQRWQSAGALRNALVEEARCTGVAISGPQIRDWIEWSFQQSARRDSSVDRLLHELEPSLSVEIEYATQRTPTPAPSDAAPTVDVRIPPQATFASLLASRAATPTPFIAARAGTPPFVAKPLAPAPELRPSGTRIAGRARAPRWRAPTRWAQPPRRSSVAPVLILLALAVFAVVAADQGLLDLAHWRDILGS